jgi:hypothetical protein
MQTAKDPVNVGPNQRELKIMAKGGRKRRARKKKNANHGKRPNA